jgi:hypothetical protein
MFAMSELWTTMKMFIGALAKKNDTITRITCASGPIGGLRKRMKHETCTSGTMISSHERNCPNRMFVFWTIAPAKNASIRSPSLPSVSAVTMFSGVMPIKSVR